MLLAGAAVLLSSIIPTTTCACSLVSCRDRGVEFQRNFTIAVVHAGKPLPGVSIQITGTTLEAVPQLFFVQTSSNGTAHFFDVPPGEYWISAELFGIGAGYECFHVNPHASRKAQKKRRYEWGDEAPAFRQATGRFLDSQPSKGGTPLQNLLHRAEVPVVDATMELRQPLTGALYKTLSDMSGRFAFEHIPNGTYVLHIEGGDWSENRALSADGILVAFADTAKQQTLLIVHRDASGGSCGGTGIEFRDYKAQ